MLFTVYVTMLRILFLVISCSCVLAQEANEAMDVFRLPNNTEPISYRLNIKPIMDSKNNNFTFTGDVTIKIKVKTSTDELTLNADGLKVTSIGVTDTNDTSTVVVVNSHTFVVKNEQLKIKFNKPGFIADRVYDVQIGFSGQLANDMIGFYKSSYFDEESKSTKWLAVTQFEPTYARRAFPCYDEPAFKTPFSIYITRLDTQISLSNMPRDRFYQVSSLGSNYICDQYLTTDPIPTYLVAFSVSEFVNTTNNQRINVYTHKDYIDQVKYIQDKSEKLLNLMEIYTNIPYPYPKLDLLALPDFSYGAMENWGLNTYREIYLLVNEKSTEKDKEFVTTTVQHELSHQWFGDLVTCSSWNYLWLNEAFATLFEYFAVEVAEPDWRIGDMFVIEQHQAALLFDHRLKHPITASVNSPSDIENIFDEITYNKGASVLRMLKHTMTEELFRKSLSLYLNTNKYASVEPKDLWDSFDNVLYDAEYKLGLLENKFTVGQYMSTWTDQAGYPVVNVRTTKDNKWFIISQKRFQIDLPKLKDTSLWHIGLTYTTQTYTNFDHLQPTAWLNNTQTKAKMRKEAELGWVIFNLQSTGFYRVNYDLQNWNMLIEQLMSNYKEIHVLNRAQLIDDSFNLARAGELSYVVPLTLINYLDKEHDFIPMYSALNGLTYLQERSRRCPHTGPQVQELTKKYAEIVYKKVSYQYIKKDSKHLTKTSMNAFSNWACILGVEACVNSSLSYFNKWQKNKEEIPPDVKEAALCVGVKNGTKETWNNVFNLFLKTSSASEKQAALLALACSTNRTILSNYLNLLLNENCPIRPQDYKIVFKSLAATPDGINVTTNFLQNKINDSLKNMWEGEQMIMQMYSTLASKVATVKEMNELKAIRNLTYLSPTLKKSFDESYNEVELNSAYFVWSHPLIHEWFNPSVSVSTPSPSGAISYLYINGIVLPLIFVLILLKNNYSLVN